MNKKVVVGMSGGVDSSLTAMLLKEQGYDVVGLFMRNWREQDTTGCCTADEDFQDVKDVCNKIGIPYYSVDFSHEYFDRVFKDFVEEYKKGRTPNPDVLCNKEIKFDRFLNYALSLGCDYVATGHYCNVEHENGKNYLCKAKDQNKDQTYFLNQVTSAQLEKVMFPVGNLNKNEVRALAEKFGLSTAEKKDSTGICFIGERNFRQFLAQYIPMKSGVIKDLEGNIVGNHNGVYYYTLGQRKGLGIGGCKEGNGSRWFVADKDVKNNILYVSQGEPDILFNKGLVASGFNFIPQPPAENEFKCTARIRHRQSEQKCTAYILEDKSVKIIFDEPQRAIAPGQYVVLYRDKYCIGGGVIENIIKS